MGGGESQPMTKPQPRISRLVDVRTRQLMGLVLVAAAIAGCSVSLRTAPAPAEACLLALRIGTLVEDPRSGLGIKDVTGEVTPVTWPFGYSTRPDFGGLALVDERGAVVAHVGDTVELGGGGDDFWIACGLTPRA
jgi:hypothetical protein